MPVDGLVSHLATGVTTVARAWALTRRDGTAMGFTDHDCDLQFDGQTFRADSGLSASALEQSTGLSVDNTEAVGALTTDGIRAADIDAGRYDGADVVSWLVNWRDVSQRRILFRGKIGAITRANGAFRAELRGLSDVLNQPKGRVFQKPCAAIFGDAACGIDASDPAYRLETDVVAQSAGQCFDIATTNDVPSGWFCRGRLEVLTGEAAGLFASIKHDGDLNGVRRIETWGRVRATVAPGDRLRLTAGCDKQFATCVERFGNGVNFRGFPDLPTDDWSMALPANAGTKSGGSRR